MCGIVGYVGKKDAGSILLSGLKRLEYRGYDSAGIALLDESGAWILKSPGRVSDLEEKLRTCPEEHPDTGLGIAHTRWATHGAPTKENAHPHRAGGVTLVHNGIVENAHEKKAGLLADGVVFSSETDTEVIVHRIARVYRGDCLAAIREGLCGLRGTWALAVLFDDRPDCLYVLRKDSPLYIGIGQGECVAASDLAALPEGMTHYLIPEEGEIAMLSRQGACVWAEDGTDITDQKPLSRVPIRAADAEKGDYPHFMRKEIAEESGVLAGLIGLNLAGGAQKVFKKELPDLSFVDRIHLVGCGSAMHAGLLGQNYIEAFARVPVQVHVASEFRYADPILSKNDLVIVISQSGETADSLAALRLAKSRCIPTCAVVNVPGSTMTREADAVLELHAGPEIAVATTKAFSAQVCVLALLALRLAADRGALSEVELKEKEADLRALPKALGKTEELFAQIQTVSEIFKEAEHCFFLGRGIDYAVSMEGALKLKEISYIHCEAYPAGELKHGTISLITEGTLCVAFATDRRLLEKTLSGIKEVRARGARVLTLIRAGEAFEEFSDFGISLPEISDWLAPFCSVLALQYFAYCIALKRGCDVDKPRNLAKSVTVE